MTQSIQKIGVLGAGTMGAGITQQCAQSGYPVVLCDRERPGLDQAISRMEKSLQKFVKKEKLTAEQATAALGRVTLAVDMTDLADCDLVIEATPEDLALKQSLFAALDAHCKPGAILASNTSSLSITALGGATKRPQQVAGLHFFNPVPLMRLVEVIQGHRTAPEVMEALNEFARGLDKIPVTAKDTPGFIVNRIATPFYGEGLKILGEQGGTTGMAETIDLVMREAGGFKMGPFELMDLVGVDVHFSVTKAIWDAYFQVPRYRPHPIQQRLVSAGLLGRKSGEGFYRYDA